MGRPLVDERDLHGLRLVRGPKTVVSTGRGGAVQEPVAIIGMGALFPGATDLSSYRDNLFAGRTAITDAPAGRWDTRFHVAGAAGEAPRADHIYTRRGGFLDDTVDVDVIRHGIMPSSVQGAEPDQLIALHVSAEALADAGGLPEGIDRARVGVILGRGGYMTPGMVRLDQRVRTAGQLVETLSELVPSLDDETAERIRAAFAEQLGPEQPDAAIGLVPNLAASRVANRLDLRGAAYTVDAACASSLVAIDHAVRELESGRLDLVLAGGVHHAHDITLWSVFAQLRALSPSGLSRPFDAASDGILVGEGTGVVALKRLTDARRDGDRVYAVIRGTGVASDGRTASLMNPDPGGQTRAVRDAWARAGLDPRSDDGPRLVEAHGTGTPAGDTAELTTVAEVFGGPGGASGVIGSVKSMIGHAMPAAGAAGIIKAALAVYHGVLPPTCGVTEPHPALASTRFRTIAEAEEWAERGPRRAGVNAFGFGGINAHVVLEQAPDTPAVPIMVGGRTFDADRAKAAASSPSSDVPTLPGLPLLLLAADTAEELAAMLDEADETLIAAASSTGSPASWPGTGPVRLAIADPTPKRLTLARRIVSRGTAWTGRSDVWYRPAPLVDGTRGAPELVFCFPGLEAEFAAHIDDVVRCLGLPAPEGLVHLSGGDTRDLSSHGASVLQVSRVLARALERVGVHPDAVAGHSLGEWSAMVVGGIFSDADVDAFLDTVDPESLVVDGLAFGVIGASADVVAADVAGRSDVVLSHDNAPHQVMVCGTSRAVDEMVESMRASGYVSRTLPFGSGFHSPFFEPYLPRVVAASSGFGVSPAAVPVWSATTVAPFPADEDGILEIFRRHLLEPVRFRELVETLHERGARIFVQLGPGQLGTLVADTLSGRDHLVVAANTAHRSGLDQLRCVLAALWSAGRDVDLRVLGFAPQPTAARVERHVAPAERSRTVLDLTSALVHLPDLVRDELSTALSAVFTPASPSIPASAAATSPAAGPTDRVALMRAADGLGSAVVAELRAYLDSTDELVSSVLAGAVARAGSTAHTTRAAAPLPSSSPPPPPAPTPLAAFSRDVEVSLRAMPYLADHCFFPQPDDWPDIADRFPVVPGTTIVQLLADAAAASTGRTVAAVHDVELRRWVDASEPHTVRLEAEPAGTDRLSLRFGSSSRLTAQLADTYTPGPAPWATPWDADGASANAVETTPPNDAGERLYTDRWMFHGPRYQGVRHIDGVGPMHVRGRFVVPTAPGSLLDNVGQLLGYWLLVSHTHRTVVFPVGMRSIRFHGPHPEPGSEVSCTIRITTLSDALLVADAQLTVDGDGTPRVWASIEGWTDRRFDNHPETRAVEIAPDRNALSEKRPGDWVVVFERWPDLASRDLIMRNHLARLERAAHEASPPRGRRERLLGRIAVKDAVRHLTWDERPGSSVFPSEIEVVNADTGRPLVRSPHGRTRPGRAWEAYDVSLAHRHEAAVAIARPATTGGRDGTAVERLGVGIDIETIEERPESTRHAACDAEERALLDVLERSGAAPVVSFTRFWSAKEAVAKALGTGLGGDPRRFRVVEAAPEDADGTVVLTVDVDDRRFLVPSVVVANPPDLPDRRYVVAWTTPEHVVPVPGTPTHPPAASARATAPAPTTEGPTP